MTLQQNLYQTINHFGTVESDMITAIDDRPASTENPSRTFVTKLKFMGNYVCPKTEIVVFTYYVV